MQELTIIPGSSNGEDEQFLLRLFKVIDTYEDLFGSKLSASVEQKLRFAIPTADLGYAYSPSEPALSEKKYRAIKRKLLSWPLGRAFIYSPHSIMERIHKNSYETFMTAVKILKPKLTSRKRSLSPSPANSMHKQPREHSPANKRGVKSRSNSPRHSHSSTSHRNDSVNEFQINFYERMINILNANSEIMSNVADKVSNLTSKITSIRSGFRIRTRS
jgi:hypothetical protein